MGSGINTTLIDQIRCGRRQDLELALRMRDNMCHIGTICVSYRDNMLELIIVLVSCVVQVGLRPVWQTVSSVAIYLYGKRLALKYQQNSHLDYTHF